MNIKKYLPRITWKNKDIYTQNKEMLIVLIQAESIIKSLNIALSESNENLESIKAEAISFLSAITFQHGGELEIKEEFFDVLTDPSNENLKLKIEKKENNNTVLRLDTVEPQESAEKEDE